MELEVESLVGRCLGGNGLCVKEEEEEEEDEGAGRGFYIVHEQDLSRGGLPESIVPKRNNFTRFWRGCCRKFTSWAQR